jgi:hypothetical protein
MNGALDRCQRLYLQEVAPRVAARLPQAVDRLAAGLVGEGSECFGFDDELSRDHDWGPAVCLWLRREDHPELAGPLEALLADLPARFEDLPLRRSGPEAAGRTGVLELGAFYRRFTGLERPPASPEEWLGIPEHALAACSNGRVFSDPCGAFTRYREQLLAHYPEPVRRLKLAACLAAAAQAGQYNLPRCLRRRDPVSAALAQAAFMRHAMGAAFLLARRYRPFYKWMHRALADLPEPGPSLAAGLRELAQATEPRARADGVEAIAALLVQALGQAGLTASREPFLLAHSRELRQGLRDPGLLALNPGLEG